MKSVLISIQPKWCELIASGKKTVEVRKTKPKLETPFKCYIYETKDSKYKDIGVAGHRSDGTPYIFVNAIGKVIGEFVCDAIFPMSILYSNPNDRLALREFPFTCLSDREIMDYLGNGGDGYGWHISDLVIYDEPRELIEFVKPCNHDNDCCTCDRYDYIGHRCYNEITRPPQSWCYVEGE